MRSPIGKQPVEKNDFNARSLPGNSTSSRAKSAALFDVGWDTPETLSPKSAAQPSPRHAPVMIEANPDPGTEREDAAAASSSQCVPGECFSDSLRRWPPATCSTSFLIFGSGPSALRSEQLMSQTICAHERIGESSSASPISKIFREAFI